MRIYRVDPTSGDKQAACRDKDGNFVLGSPLKGALKHHKENKVLTASEDEAVRLVLSGHSIRVETRSAPSLVNRNVFVDGKQIR